MRVSSSLNGAADTASNAFLPGRESGSSGRWGSGQAQRLGESARRPRGSVSVHSERGLVDGLCAAKKFRGRSSGRVGLQTHMLAAVSSQSGGRGPEAARIVRPGRTRAVEAPVLRGFIHENQGRLEAVDRIALRRLGPLPTLTRAAHPSRRRGGSVWVGGGEHGSPARPPGPTAMGSSAGKPRRSFRRPASPWSFRIRIVARPSVRSTLGTLRGYRVR